MDGGGRLGMAGDSWKQWGTVGDGILSFRLPYNPAKVGLALVRIFLNLPNHRHLYV